MESVKTLEHWKRTQPPTLPHTTSYTTNNCILTPTSPPTQHQTPGNADRLKTIPDTPADIYNNWKTATTQACPPPMIKTPKLTSTTSNTNKQYPIQHPPAHMRQTPPIQHPHILHQQPAIDNNPRQKSTDRTPAHACNSWETMDTDPPGTAPKMHKRKRRIEQRQARLQERKGPEPRCCKLEQAVTAWMKLNSWCEKYNNKGPWFNTDGSVTRASATHQQLQRALQRAVDDLTQEDKETFATHILEMLEVQMHLPQYAPDEEEDFSI